MTLDMRTIKFRGKCCHSDAWAYGNLVDYGEDENPEIQGFDVYNEGSDVWQERSVERDTIGQFTGLYDKNGKEIYEGDIVAEGAFKRLISFIPEAAAFCSCSPYESSIRTRTSADEMRFYEVIGNIHDDEQLV